MAKHKYAQLENVCSLCSATVRVGDEIWPVTELELAAPHAQEDQSVRSAGQPPPATDAGARPAPMRAAGGAAQFVWTHLRCAQERAGSAALVAPVCPHFLRKGRCWFVDDCFYEHPPELAAEARAKGEGAGAGQGKGKGKGTGKGKRRSKNSNYGKAGIFRRWLLAHYDAVRMRQGEGLLDIAGGKGELSFELQNLNDIPCTVIDPRTVVLSQFVKKLEAGLYARNHLFRQFLGEGYAANCAAPQIPRHLKIFFTHDLIRWLAARPRAPGAQEALAPPPGATCPLAVAGARSRGFSFGGRGGGASPLAGGYAMCECADPDCAGAGSGAGGDEGGNGGGTGSSGDEGDEGDGGDPGAAGASFFAAALAASSGRILVGESSKFSEFQRQYEADRKYKTPKAMAAVAASAGDGDVAGGAADAGAAAASTGAPPLITADGIEDEGAAVGVLTRCSMLVGMHVDGAAEALVDFALAFNKPFAVVPCCTCSKDFPNRSRANPTLPFWSATGVHLVCLAIPPLPWAQPSASTVSTRPACGRHAAAAA